MTKKTYLIYLVYTPDNKYFGLRYEDGKMTVETNMELDDQAKLFWQTIGDQALKNILAAKVENDE